MQMTVPTFTVNKNDALWPQMAEAYRNITRGVTDAKQPDNEMLVNFAVRAVGPKGATIDGYPEKLRLVVVVDTDSNRDIHAAALAYAAEKGGQADLGRAALKVIAIRLNNAPVVEEGPEPAETEEA